MSQVALKRLLEKFPDAVVSSHAQHGDETAVVKASRLLEVMTFLRDDEVTSFEMLIDVTGVDLLGHEEPRFQVVYHLYSVSKNHRLRIKVGAEEEDPRVPSVIGLWKSATWMEREAFDLYGIKFDGHPDLRRILLYPEFEGHPLRKDYPMEHRQPRIPPWPGRRHL
ncbi:NADH-quinone oxidoreductase subunit C [Myxococcota bacterium]|nr:NADH-quinone oxidoreductase subunit C [Myxococcota bacterium]